MYTRGGLDYREMQSLSPASIKIMQQSNLYFFTFLSDPFLNFTLDYSLSLAALLGPGQMLPDGSYRLLERPVSSYLQRIVRIYPE